LEYHVNKTPSFKKDLEDSLKKAQCTARLALNPDLYNAFLQDGVQGWPTNVEDYYSFLRWYASFVPQQHSYLGWKADPSKPASSYQEVYDPLCHFYYLVDQPGSDGRIVENDKWFAEWLVEYANVWGKFCDSTDSITPESIYSFNERSPSFNVRDSMIPWNKENYPPAVGGTVKFPPYTIFNEKQILTIALFRLLVLLVLHVGMFYKSSSPDIICLVLGPHDHANAHSCDSGD